MTDRLTLSASEHSQSLAPGHGRRQLGHPSPNLQLKAIMPSLHPALQEKAIDLIEFRLVCINTHYKCTWWSVRIRILQQKIPREFAMVG